jgi:hypothetical protein
MSTYGHDFLTARFAALAPRPLPGDWDDVLDRAGAVGARRRRLAPPSLWRGSRRRKLVVELAIAVLLTAVATAAYGTVRVVFLDKGFIGLPPLGATPSAPENGKLVVHWEEFWPRHDFARVWVYADGRVIWDRESQVPGGATEFTSGYLEQRLTPEGVMLVRSALGDLVDRSRSLLKTRPDDPRPTPYGGLALFVPTDYPAWHGSVDVPDGDRVVGLQWQNLGTGPDVGWVREHYEGTNATPEQLSALRRLDAMLALPASVLPPSAWAVREVRAYVPSHYAVCIHTSPPKDPSQLLALLPTRAADALRDKSRTRYDGEVLEAREGGRTVVLGRSVTYCSKLTTEEARGVADALSVLKRESGWGANSLTYQVTEPVGLEDTDVFFEPYLPHGRFHYPPGG